MSDRTHHHLRIRHSVKIVIAIVLSLSAVSSSASPTNSGTNWVGTWACSPQLVEPQNMPPTPGLSGNTLRQVIHLTLGGHELRLRFSNEFSKTPLGIASVHIALPADSVAGTIRPDSDTAITFAGKPSIKISGSAMMFSDPVKFSASPLSDLVVTIQFDEVPEDITGHPGSRQTSFIAAGNQVSAATLTTPVTTEHWYILDGVDTDSAEDSAALVTLGDSITDGRGSITNQNTRWPDNVARILAADKKLSHISVLNQGIGGNRITRDGLGPNALARFDRDVIAQARVRWVIIFEGVNDIGSTKAATDEGAPSTMADDIIHGYQQFILRAHAHGIKVYGATITPFGQSFYYNASTESDRQKVNEWIRTSHQFDAVIDFDKAVRDPAKPSQLTADTDSGDHLHLNSEGYRRIAAAIDLNLFRR
jgi:lysophospholipase L1-like esterase